MFNEVPSLLLKEFCCCKQYQFFSNFKSFGQFVNLRQPIISINEWNILNLFLKYSINNKCYNLEIFYSINIVLAELLSIYKPFSNAIALSSISLYWALSKLKLPCTYKRNNKHKHIQKIENVIYLELFWNHDPNQWTGNGHWTSGRRLEADPRRGHQKRTRRLTTRFSSKEKYFD